MDPDFFHSPYSYQFDILKIWGAWPLDNPSPRVKKYFRHYSHAMFVLILLYIFMGFLDFVESINDYRKISWNLSVNLTIILTLVKNVSLFRKSEGINALRRNLYRPLKSCKTVKEIFIFEENQKNFEKLVWTFYCPYFVLFPIWALDALYLYLKDGKVPLPCKWIYEIGDDQVGKMIVQYVVHVTFAALFLYHAITTDLAMFGVMFQLYREYEYLLCEVEDLDEFCRVDEGSEPSQNRLNKILKKKKMKLMLQKIIDRQREIIKFTEDFENNYSGSMLPQVFMGGVLFLMNCVQTLTLSLEFNLKSTPQGAYSMVMIYDMFIMCFLSTRISDRCREIGYALYDIPWFTLDVDLRKDILIALMRSQKTPKITSGKLFELNLMTFSEIIKNIYRFFAAFRQLGFR